MPQPSDCAPGDPRIEADLSDFVNWDPDVRFTPEDATKPRGAGVAVDTSEDSDALVEQLALEAELKARRREHFEDKQPWYSQAVNMVRVPQELFRSLERHTNVPFYRWFRQIEDAIDDVDIASTDTLKELRTLAQRVRATGGFFKINNREERKQVQRLFEQRFHDSVGTKELEAKLPPQVVVAADQLSGIYQRYFEQQGLNKDEVDDFFKAFGALREKDGDYLAHKKGSRIPKIMQSMEQEFKTGEIMLDNREWDFHAIGERLVRAHARQRHLGPTWNLVKAQVEAIESEGVVSRDLLDYFHSYIDEVRYAPDHWQMSVGRFMNKVTKQLTGNTLSNAEIVDYVPSFLTVNYFSNMAWNTGVAIRNYMQPWVTSYPILGERFSWEGYRAALTAAKDPAKLAQYARLGVITRDVEPLQSGAIREAMALRGGVVGGTKAADFMNWIHDNGWTWFRSAENTNRIMSYQGMVNRIEHFAKDYRSGDMSWAKFHEVSKMDFIDPGDGPLSQQLRRLIDSGDTEKAAHLSGLEFTRKTQFVYRRGNTPYVMQGSVGRLLGQYGTWPAWYLSYMSDMVFKGSYQNRLTALARWTAANSAVVAGASSIFGVETSRWAFFSPMGYTGGPFVEMGRDAIAAFQVAAGSEDPVERIQAGRLKQAYAQVTPLPWGGLRNMRDSVNAALDDDWKTAAKRFMGFHPTEEAK